VFGRGGGTLDRFADVHYLTGHYPCFPAIPDNGLAWRGRGHAAVLLTETGGTELVLDEPDTDSPVVDPDRVHGGHDIVAGLVGLLERRDLGESRLGLVGTEVLSVAHRDALAAALPGLTLVHADEILSQLRACKSEAEVALLRHAARIGMAQVDAMVRASVVGATEADLAAAACAVLARAGGSLANLFIESTGPGGLTPMRRLPTFDSQRRLVDGDLVLIDVTGVVGGYWFDLSRSWIVGGTPTEAQHELMQLTRAAVWDVVGRLIPGTTVSDAIAPAVDRMREAGHPIEQSEFAAFGHSLGLGFERPWLTTDNDTPLQPGMVLCVERAVWTDTDAASHEETVLVTPGAPEVLTSLDR
jgi:Xaa-Pro aminopeptidase